MPLLLLACGENLIHEVSRFTPNTQPTIESIVLKTSQNATFAVGTEVLPGDVFFLEFNIPENEKDVVFVEYNSQIGNTSLELIFNNQRLDNSNESLVKASTTIVVPNTLPLNEQVYFTITTSDAKGAQTSYQQYLGPVKLKPIITEVNAPIGPYSTPLIVDWQANSNGFYQKYLLNSTAIACSINSNELVYNYAKNAQVSTTLAFIGANKKVCIIVFDALNQTAILEYLLP